MAIGNLPELSSNDEVRTSNALMARLNYGFMNKYLLTLSVRKDGSSLFGYSNPYATFPAAALGWVISEEKFFKVKFVDYLNEVRIEKSKELLKDSNRKMYQISKAVGYDNPKYFFRIFKKKTGMTPEQYREML